MVLFVLIKIQDHWEFLNLYTFYFIFYVTFTKFYKEFSVNFFYPTLFDYKLGTYYLDIS